MYTDHISASDLYEWRMGAENCKWRRSAIFWHIPKALAKFFVFVVAFFCAAEKGSHQNLTLNFIKMKRNILRWVWYEAFTVVANENYSLVGHDVVQFSRLTLMFPKNNPPPQKNRKDRRRSQHDIRIATTDLPNSTTSQFNRWSFSL
jgi:hypothetical protein